MTDLFSKTKHCNNNNANLMVMLTVAALNVQTIPMF